VGSIFLGEGYFNPTGSNIIGENSLDVGDNVFACRIKDYGELLNNSSTSCPPCGDYDQSNIDSTTYPLGNDKGALGYNITRNNVTTTYALSELDQTKLMQYIKIADGLVLQPGEWTNNDYEGITDRKPEMDFKPNMSQPPIIRLLFTSNVSTPFYVLFTGFTHRTVIEGTTGIDTSVHTGSPEDGDFLGPATYPWANKIIFHTPGILTYYIKNGIQPYQPSDEEKSEYGEQGTEYDNVEIHQDDDTPNVGIEVRKQISPKSGTEEDGQSYNNVTIYPAHNAHKDNVTVEVQKQITAANDNVIITPEYNRHQTDTSIEVRKNVCSGASNIRVDNTTDDSTSGDVNHSTKTAIIGIHHIHTDDTFTTIIQKNGESEATNGDGASDTQISIDSGKLVGSGLTTTGIGIEQPESPGEPTKLSLELSSGTGIGIEDNGNGQYVINNTMTGAGLSRLKYGENKDYTIEWFNGYRPGRCKYSSSSGFTITYPDNEAINKEGTYCSEADINSYMSVKVALSKTGDTITGGTLQISTSDNYNACLICTNEEGTKPANLCADDGNFYVNSIRHAQASYSDSKANDKNPSYNGVNSRICKIKFNPDSEYKCLNSCTFTKNSIFTGIWNLKSSTGNTCGASWNANVTIEPERYDEAGEGYSKGDKTKKGVILSIAQYADGYNGQFATLAKGLGIDLDKGDGLYLSEYANMNITASFTISSSES
jgi:hypothetical protein